MRCERPRRRQAGPLIRRPKVRPRILVLGIGNPGRGDDGLGPRAVELIEVLRLRGVTCDANYQLNLEDALACSLSDIVIFVDAARRARPPFIWRGVRTEARLPVMSHGMGPGAVLAVCAELYGRRPEAHILAIRGHRWRIREGISARAERNLREAIRFLRGFLKRAGGKGAGP